MQSHRAESPSPRRRTDRPDISRRRQARGVDSGELSAPVEPAASVGSGPTVESGTPQYATLAPGGLLEAPGWPTSASTPLRAPMPRGEAPLAAATRGPAPYQPPAPPSASPGRPGYRPGGVGYRPFDEQGHLTPPPVTPARPVRTISPLQPVQPVRGVRPAAAPQVAARSGFRPGEHDDAAYRRPAVDPALEPVAMQWPARPAGHRPVRQSVTEVAPRVDPRDRSAAPPDGFDLFGGATAFQAPAAAPAGVVKAGPQQPMSRAQLRAAQGPLTSSGRAGRRGGSKGSAAAKDPKPTRTGGKASGRNRGLSLPQVGVASALGLATIAAPLSGALSAPAAKSIAEPLPAISVEAPVAAFGVVAAEDNAVQAATLVPGSDQGASVPSTLAAPRSIIVTRASRDSERSVLPGCDGKVPARENWRNGQIPTGELCTLWEAEHMLRADAAVSLAKLNIAYKKRFGHNICLTDSYRTLSSQRRLRAQKPSLAAVPGTSNHGWGVAVDLCDGVQNYNSAQYRWMRANAPAYGWDNPEWALPAGSGPFEAWHWEYLPGEKYGPGSD